MDELPSTSTQLYRSFKFLLQATVLHEERPRHAADHGRHAALAGRCGVWLAELQGAGRQVDLCAQTRHRVNVEVVLLTLQIQSGGSRDETQGVWRRKHQLCPKPTLILYSMYNKVNVDGLISYLLSNSFLPSFLTSFLPPSFVSVFCSFSLSFFLPSCPLSFCLQSSLQCKLKCGFGTQQLVKWLNWCIRHKQLTICWK